MSEDNNTMQCRIRKEGEGRDEKYIYNPVNVPMLPVDQEFSDKVDEMMREKTKGTNRRSLKALEEENAELRAEIERLTSPECADELMNDHIKGRFSKPASFLYLTDITLMMFYATLTVIIVISIYLMKAFT